MKNTGIIFQAEKPLKFEIINGIVIIRYNIRPYEKTFNNELTKGWKFNFRQYSKDEYLLKQQEELSSLEDAVIELAEIIGG
jgi:hypothetical protein